MDPPTPGDGPPHAEEGTQQDANDHLALHRQQMAEHYARHHAATTTASTEATQNATNAVTTASATTHSNNTREASPIPAPAANPQQLPNEQAEREAHIVQQAEARIALDHAAHHAMQALQAAQAAHAAQQAGRRQLEQQAEQARLQQAEMQRGQLFVENAVEWTFYIARGVFRRLLYCIHFSLVIIGLLVLLSGAQYIPQLSIDYSKLILSLILPQSLVDFIQTSEPLTMDLASGVSDGISIKKSSDQAVSLMEMKTFVHVPIIAGIVCFLAGGTGLYSIRGSRGAAAVCIGVIFLCMGLISLLMDPLRDVDIMDQRLEKVKVFPGSTSIELDHEQFFFFVFLKETYTDFTKVVVEAKCHFKQAAKLTVDPIYCLEHEAGQLLEKTFEIIWEHAIKNDEKVATLNKVADCNKNVKKFLDTTPEASMMYCRARVAMFGFVPYIKVFFMFLLFSYMVAGCVTAVFPYEKEIVHMWKHTRTDLYHFITFGVCVACIMIAKVTVLSESLFQPTE